MTDQIDESGHAAEHDPDSESAGMSRTVALAKLLSTGATQGQAAESFGVTDRTIRRWIAEDGVAAEIRRCEEEHFSRLSAGVVDVGHRALQVVRELLDSDDPRIRLRAAAVSLNATGARGDSAIAIRLRNELRDRAVRPSDPWTTLEQPPTTGRAVTPTACISEQTGEES
jgi:hypothetical protein